jgi:fibronectin type 3 domain-containing protein
MPLSELSGYRIYYLREGSDASDDVTVVVHGGNTTTYNLTLGAPGSYTFAVTAVDLAGLESPLSGEVSIPVR